MSSPASVFELSTRVLEARRPRAPTSQPQARPINQRPKTPQELLDSFMDWYQNGLPVYPSYLKGTVYEQLANEQYKIYCKKRSTDPGIPRNPSQTQSNALDYPKSLRAMSTLQIQDTLTERLVANDLRLPTAWNPDQKGEFVEMSQDHLQLSYEGIGKKDSDIAAVRANFPMRHQCGIYYFEVEIISKGVDGHIGIGFCWPSSKLNRLPGWEVHSWGYHGDDGHIFSGPETSRKYGPKFSTGDIIGCGVDFRDMTAFYTKNGVHLGTAFKNITGNILYPFVGFKTKGEKIRANFGSQKYKYDIEQYIKSERTQMQDSVYQSTPLCLDPARPAKVDRPSIEESKSKDVMNALVLDYLDYYGYYNTAQALKASSVKSKLAGDEAVLTKTESADTRNRYGKY
ncbi:concanavalin A-like lectin/glucanase domain-containing protein [Phycomyces nitens]|nr:concanavalin A-like lectin/glucanase domain-containing protein [Phycomyces nitens]